MEATASGYDVRIRERLDREEWEPAITMAYRHAIWHSRSLSEGGIIVGPYDLVSEAYSLAFGRGSSSNGKGFRNWNESKYPTLGEFLVNIIDSIVNHMWEHRKAAQMHSLDGELSSDTKKSLAAAFDRSRTRTPEEELLTHLRHHGPETSGMSVSYKWTKGAWHHGARVSPS